MKRRKVKTNRFSSNSKLIIIFILSLCFMSVGYSLLSESLSLTGKGNLIITEEEVSDDISFRYDKNNWYSNGFFYYNYTGYIKNQTDDQIEGWNIEIKVPTDITEVVCWNANCSVNNGILVFSNVDYNSILNPNNEISFGFQLHTSTENLELNNVKINGNSVFNEEEKEEEKKDFDINLLNIDLSLNSSWKDSGYTYNQYDILVKNNTGYDLKKWHFELCNDNDFELINVWNANYIVKDNSIILSNNEWNGNIANGDILKISFQIKSKNKNVNLSVRNIVGEI